MSNLMQAVSDGLSEEEKALFVNTVAGVETTVSAEEATKGAKKVAKKAKAVVKAAPAISEVTVESVASKPVSKYAAKKLSDVESTLTTPIIAPNVVTEARANAIDAIFGSLVSDLLGDAQSDMNEMLRLRREGFAMLEKGKQIDISSIRWRAENDSRAWENEQILEAQRRIFNDLRDPGKYGDKSPILTAMFVELEDAYHKKGGDPMKRAKFLNMVEKVMLAFPSIKEKHDKNIERGLAVLEEVDAKQAEKDRLMNEGGAMLDKANEIASAHGWPTTEKKSNPKGGDVNRK